jgi:hypothetical protein
MSNVIMIIVPYRHEGTWVFDDPVVGLNREPFVAGMPEMIDELVRAIPDAQKGFRLTFAACPFPGYQMVLSRDREETGGWWYRSEHSKQEGWLCPALNKYFKFAPQKIYIRADSRI